MRFHDWPQRLDAYIAESRTTPFEYGSHDCCWFAGKAVEAMTGENPMHAFNYRNRLGAERMIRRAGTLDALVNRALGEPVHPSQAGRGDVVIMDGDGGSSVGICLGEVCAFATEPVGLLLLPRQAARAAWCIG